MARDSNQSKYNLDDYQLYDKPPALDHYGTQKKPPRTLNHKRQKSVVDDAIKSITRKDPPRLAGLARRPIQG